MTIGVYENNIGCLCAVLTSVSVIGQSNDLLRLNGINDKFNFGRDLQILYHAAWVGHLEANSR